MKNLKTFAIVLAILFSGNAFASKEKPRSEKNSNSYELEKLLEDPSLELQGDYFGKVIFSINDEREIVLHCILTKEEFVRNYINEKLAGHVLTENRWEVGKIYHLPVKMKMKK